MMRQSVAIMKLSFLLLSVLVVLAHGEDSDCAHKAFTWVAREDDNPYFWKSPSFDWNAISTLAVFSDFDTPARQEMRDFASGRGIKVVGAKSPSSIDMNDPDARMQWVNETVQYAIDQKMTGINVDYEGNKKQLTEGYNSAVVELCEAMHAAIPGSEVSIDVPIYPSYEHRNYDYKRMSSACDSLFIMAYDGEFWDNVQCAISQAQCSLACAPLSNVEMGIKEYISQGVPASKLFLGLPWYGLKYERVLNIPFFTGQLQYSAIMDIIKKAGDKGSLKFDDNSSTYVFSCGGKCSQWSDEITDFTSEIWFDNPTSLAPKYALATKYKLAGVGMWEATHVKYDPNTRTKDADAMWDSLCQRTK